MRDNQCFGRARPWKLAESHPPPEQPRGHGSTLRGRPRQQRGPRPDRLGHVGRLDRPAATSPSAFARPRPGAGSSTSSPSPTSTPTAGSTCWASPRRAARAGARAREQSLPLAGHPAPGREGLRRRPDQLVRPRRRGRGPGRPARSEAGDQRADRPFRPGRSAQVRRRPDRLAQRDRRRRSSTRRPTRSSSPSSGSRAPARSCSPSTAPPCASSPTSSGGRRWASASTHRTRPALAQTEDWVKIRGDQLAPRDGVYDVRITAELWETHYWDHVSLMVVDHPSGTEVFVDERFARQPPPLAVHADRAAASRRLRPGRSGPRRDSKTSPPATAATWTASAAASTRGSRATTGSRSSSATTCRATGRSGWWRTAGFIPPTARSTSPSVRAGEPSRRAWSWKSRPPDGGWTVARADLGFPAGKNKTILVDLDGIFRPRRPPPVPAPDEPGNLLGFARRRRRPRPRRRSKTQRLAPQSAELRLRGYSLMTQADASSPELPRLRHAHRHGPALARPDRLLHPVRRRPRAARRRSTIAT